MGKTIKDVEVVDAEKRRVPSKHYVYVIVVRWSDGSCFKIYRRYSRFFDLQTVLLDNFPIEGGTLDPNKRVIPFLPGKIFFGRSHIKDVAMKRLGELNEYCQSLVALPSRIAQCEHVLGFFEVEPDDLDPPVADPNESKKGTGKEAKAEKISKPKRLECFVAVAEYVSQAPGELSLQPGTQVEVLEKNDIGWWFVNSEDEQGWVPSAYLEPEGGGMTDDTPRAAPGEEEIFVCIEDFQATCEDEISLEKGVAVSVIQKNMDGWWLVRYQGTEAYAPGTYLKKASNASRMSMVEKSRLSGVMIVNSLHDVSTLISSDKKPQAKSKPEPSLPDRPEKSNLPSAIIKQRSLERGGSLKPPPRQNSIKKMSVPTVTQKSGIYMTVEDFTDTVGDGLSFKQGQKVLVLEKNSSGWWLVRLDQEEGWVPASYLESCSGKLDSTSVYEMEKPLDPEPSDNVYEVNDSDGSDEWYTQPDDLTEENCVSVPPLLHPAKRPLPKIPVEDEDYEPVVEISTKPTTTPQIPLAPLQIISMTPKNNTAKRPMPPAPPKLDKTDDWEKKPPPPPPPMGGGASADLASVLKAKFESRGEDSDTAKPASARPLKPSVPAAPVAPAKFAKPSEMKKLQGETNNKPHFPPSSSNSSNQNENKALAKPAPPVKSKSPVFFEKKAENSPQSSNNTNTNTGFPKVSLKPVGSKETNSGSKPAVKSEMSGVKSMAAAFSNKTPSSQPTPVPHADKLEKPDVKRMTTAFNKSSNSQPRPPTAPKGLIAPKPQISSKPKPLLASKPNLAAKPKPGIKPKANQNVSNIAGALSERLNFNKPPAEEKKDDPQSAFGQSSGNSNINNNNNNNSNEQKPDFSNSSHVTPQPSSQPGIKTKTFVALYDFEGEGEGELSFREGDTVEILEDNGDWAFIELWDEQGWAPASFFEEI